MGRPKQRSIESDEFERAMLMCNFLIGQALRIGFFPKRVKKGDPGLAALRQCLRVFAEAAKKNWSSDTDGNLLQRKYALDGLADYLFDLDRGKDGAGEKGKLALRELSRAYFDGERVPKATQGILFQKSAGEKENPKTPLITMRNRLSRALKAGGVKDRVSGSTALRGSNRRAKGFFNVDLSPEISIKGVLAFVLGLERESLSEGYRQVVRLLSNPEDQPVLGITSRKFRLPFLEHYTKIRVIDPTEVITPILNGLERLNRLGESAENKTPPTFP